MSRLDKARLAQFWHIRVAPLLTESRQSKYWPESVYEVAGWLHEGVFCGYFDRHEADFVWIRLKETIGKFPAVSIDRVSPELEAKVRDLEQSQNPFRTAQQMPEGAQKMFEGPLMSYALLLSDRIATDVGALACSQAILSLGDSSWDALLEEEVRPSEVLTNLASNTDMHAGLAWSLAGYYRLLEHMESSRRFFDYAAIRSQEYGADSDSYRQRIGALNALRVPLVSDAGRTRFDQIGGCFDKVIMTAADEAEASKFLTVEGLEPQLEERRNELKTAWLEHHFAAFLDFA